MIKDKEMRSELLELYETIKSMIIPDDAPERYLEALNNVKSSFSKCAYGSTKEESQILFWQLSQKSLTRATVGAVLMAALEFEFDDGPYIDNFLLNNRSMEEMHEVNIGFILHMSDIMNLMNESKEHKYILH